MISEQTAELVVPKRPFGEADCEADVRSLGQEYRKYYFFHTRFNAEALRPDVYLIIGRRGAGKTALSQFFSFQSAIPGARAIDVDEPKLYQEVLSRISTYASQTREVAIPRLALIWEFVIWSVVFHHLQDTDKRIHDANVFGSEADKASSLIHRILRSILERFSRTDEGLADELEDFISNATIREGKEAVLEQTATAPLIVAFDTLENYAVHDEAMVRATAALIECAALFSQRYAARGIHLKLFVMAEMFPYLCEEAVPNTLEHVKDEVYLHWSPKDLMRLLCWRYYHFLRHNRIALPEGEVNDWDDHREVQHKMWLPFFGSTLRNGRGRLERTFPLHSATHAAAPTAAHRAGQRHRQSGEEGGVVSALFRQRDPDGNQASRAKTGRGSDQRVQLGLQQHRDDRRSIERPSHGVSRQRAGSSRTPDSIAVEGRVLATQVPSDRCGTGDRGSGAAVRPASRLCAG